MSLLFKNFLVILLFSSLSTVSQAASYEANYRDLVEWLEINYGMSKITKVIPSIDCDITIQKSDYNFMITVKRARHVRSFNLSSKRADPYYGHELRLKMSENELDAEELAFSCETQGCNDSASPISRMYANKHFLEIENPSDFMEKGPILCTLKN